MSLREKFARNILKHRAQKKLSQPQLAKKAGVCTSYVSMLERNQRAAPLDTVEKIAKALGVSPLKMLEG